MSSSSMLPHPDLGNTFGALFIGCVLAAVLSGLSIVQAFIYFQAHRDTGTTFYKLVVVWLLILDALHLALIVHSVYFYLVTNYANVDALIEAIWSFKLQIIFNVIMITGVQFLYVHRIWIVSRARSRAFYMTVGTCVSLTFGVFIAMIFVVYQNHVATDFIHYEWALYLALGSSTSTDIIIASSLCYLLTTSRTGFSSTNSLITKLVGYTINTGVLTSICSLATIITCAAMPRNYIYLGVEFLLAKLYINSYIALLNARYYLQPNTDTIASPKPHIEFNVHNPELRIRALQDNKLQTFGESLFEEEVVRPTRPAQAVMPRQSFVAMTELNSFLSV